MSGEQASLSEKMDKIKVKRMSELMDPSCASPSKEKSADSDLEINNANDTSNNEASDDDKNTSGDEKNKSSDSGSADSDSSICIERAQTKSFYFSKKEIRYAKKHFDSLSKKIDEKGLVCTACFTCILSIGSDVMPCHPVLGVLVCKKCLGFYGDGKFKKDEDGFDEYCRWCGNGGELFLCDNDGCFNGFCKICVKRNLGRTAIENIENASQWTCYLCKPNVLIQLRSSYIVAEEKFCKVNRFSRGENSKNKGSSLKEIENKLKEKNSDWLSNYLSKFTDSVRIYIKKGNNLASKDYESSPGKINVASKFMKIIGDMQVFLEELANDITDMAYKENCASVSLSKKSTEPVILNDNTHSSKNKILVPEKYDRNHSKKDKDSSVVVDHASSDCDSLDLNIEAMNRNHVKSKAISNSDINSDEVKDKNSISVISETTEDSISDNYSSDTDKVNSLQSSKSTRKIKDELFENSEQNNAVDDSDKSSGKKDLKMPSPLGLKKGSKSSSEANSNSEADCLRSNVLSANDKNEEIKKKNKQSFKKLDCISANDDSDSLSTRCNYKKKLFRKKKRKNDAKQISSDNCESDSTMPVSLKKESNVDNTLHDNNQLQESEIFSHDKLSDDNEEFTISANKKFEILESSCTSTENSNVDSQDSHMKTKEISTYSTLSGEINSKNDTKIKKSNTSTEDSDNDACSHSNHLKTKEISIHGILSDEANKKAVPKSKKSYTSNRDSDVGCQDSHLKTKEIAVPDIFSDEVVFATKSKPKNRKLSDSAEESDICSEDDNLKVDDISASYTLSSEEVVTNTLDKTKIIKSCTSTKDSGKLEEKIISVLDIGSNEEVVVSTKKESQIKKLTGDNCSENNHLKGIEISVLDRITGGEVTDIVKNKANMRKLSSTSAEASNSEVCDKESCSDIDTLENVDIDEYNKVKKKRLDENESFLKKSSLTNNDYDDDKDCAVKKEKFIFSADYYPSFSSQSTVVFNETISTESDLDMKESKPNMISEKDIVEKHTPLISDKVKYEKEDALKHIKLFNGSKKISYNCEKKESAEALSINEELDHSVSAVVDTKHNAKLTEFSNSLKKSSLNVKKSTKDSKLNIKAKKVLLISESDSEKECIIKYKTVTANKKSRKGNPLRSKKLSQTVKVNVQSLPHNIQLVLERDRFIDVDQFNYLSRKLRSPEKKNELQDSSDESTDDLQFKKLLSLDVLVNKKCNGDTSSDDAEEEEEIADNKFKQTKKKKNAVLPIKEGLCNISISDSEISGISENSDHCDEGDKKNMDFLDKPQFSQNEERKKELLLSCSDDSENSELSNDGSSDIDENTGKVLPKIKKNLAPSLSNEDMVDAKKPKKKQVAIKSDDDSNSLISDSVSDEEFDSSTKKKKSIRLFTDSDDDDFVVPKSSKSKTKKFDDDRSLVEEEEQNDEEKPKKKRKRIRHQSSSDESEVDKESPSKKKTRRIISDEDLMETTKSATYEEEERRKRIGEKQKLFNKVYEIDVEKVQSDLDKLILDFNPDKKEDRVEVNKKFIENLKPHQFKGIKFLWDATVESVSFLNNGKKGGGGILAHCMGLGKTLQVIVFVHTLLNNKKTKNYFEKVMVCCPKNTVFNWVYEFKHWLKGGLLTFEVYELASAKDNWMRAYRLDDWNKEGGVMIIGYEMFRNLSQDSKKFKQKQKEIFKKALVDPGPDLIVCDEGHVLKNEKTSLSNAINKVKTARRVVLTGTPLQNNLKECTKKEFMNRFVNPIEAGQCVDANPRDVKRMKRRSHILHNLLEGCVQRFDYSVLKPFLPPKFEYVIAVQMTELQCKLYRYYLENLAQGGPKRQGSGLFVDFNGLSRIWTHPKVLEFQERRAALQDDGDEDGELSDFINDGSTSDSSSSDEVEEPANEGKENAVDEKEEKKNIPAGLTSSGKVKADWWRLVVDKENFDYDDLDVLELSGKLILFFEILRQCDSIGDKLLVFSQSILSLDLLEDFLAMLDSGQVEMPLPEDAAPLQQKRWVKDRDYLRLDGSVSADTRKNQCNAFNNTKNIRCRLFLISTRAGGLGINLVGANRVVIFDASWNPSHDTQSIFRVYRFGQNKPCYIYRFVAQGTMEEKIYSRQVTKLSTSLRVVDEHQIKRYFNIAELATLYEFTPADPEKRETPKLPEDRLFAELLTTHKKWIVSYHEHDSLLENQEGEELTEEERKAAWEDYENEKKGLIYGQEQRSYSTLPTSIMNINYTFNVQSVIDGIKSKYPGISEADLCKNSIWQIRQIQNIHVQMYNTAKRTLESGIIVDSNEIQNYNQQMCILLNNINKENGCLNWLIKKTSNMQLYETQGAFSGYSAPINPLQNYALNYQRSLQPQSSGYMFPSDYNLPAQSNSSSTTGKAATSEPKKKVPTTDIVMLD